MKKSSLLLALCVAAPLLAHIPLHNPSNKMPLYWESPGNIAIVINSAGSDDIPDKSHVTALRNAIDAWNHISGSRAHLNENTSPAAQARTDWDANVHLILFDESNASGYFPPGSSTVAITPVYFFSNGKIDDADVLFNGSGFHFTTDDTAGRFDVEAVATHELGHFLGLDHSGWAGASMYPYVSPNGIAQRSISSDEEHGMRDRYPTQPAAEITGTVRRMGDNSIVKGAHVVARDTNGATIAAALSDGTGDFAIRGLAAGTYQLYATPLDYPVSNANLTTGHPVQTDFASTLGGTIAVAAGASIAYGDLLVDANTNTSLGRASDVLPLTAEVGTTSLFSLHGSGMSAACSLQPGDPSITVNPTFWSGSTQVTFQVDVPSGHALGHVDLELVDALGGRSILVAALELVPPLPTVNSVNPPAGTDVGGTALTITGTNFRAGDKVVIGPEIYTDGAPGGCTVVDPTTITLTTAATTSGAYDVVVIDATGIEGRAANAYDFITIPGIDTVFPLAGSDLGGTVVTVTGSNFADPMTVRIDGVAQSQVAVDSSTMLHVTTDSGIAGGPYVLEVESASHQTASAAFSYVAQLDPAISSVDPPSSPTTGGRSVTITGSDFSANTVVFFGVDPESGSGGVAAATVTYVDPNTLVVETPAHGKGAVTVMVQDASSGQATMLASAFTFTPPDGGGGGGGCAGVASGDPWNARDALSGAAWLPVLAMLAWLEMRRVRRQPPSFTKTPATV